MPSRGDPVVIEGEPSRVLLSVIEVLKHAIIEGATEAKAEIHVNIEVPAELIETIERKYGVYIETKSIVKPVVLKPAKIEKEKRAEEDFDTFIESWKEW